DGVPTGTHTDGEPLRIDDRNSQPDHGTVTQTDDHQLNYTPFPGFHGTETFTYTATDGGDSSSQATVTVTVNHVNHAPAAFRDAYPLLYVPEPIFSYASVLDNDVDYDHDGLTATLVSPPAVGSLDLHPDGTFYYTPPASGLGGAPYITVTFTYKAVDDSTAQPVALASDP